MNRWKDWLEQAKRDLKKAELDYEYKYYEWACFTAQQSAEKALKAVGYFLGFDLWGHSLTEMLNLLKEKVKFPREFEEYTKILDKYYIPTRYPNGFPSGKPADYFTEREAKEAINASSKILRFCESYISEKGRTS